MIKIQRKQIDNYEKRVDAGIRWLNKNKPGWLETINIHILNLESPSVCVLGQVFEGFWQAVRRDGELCADGRERISFDKAVKLGFAENQDEDKKQNYDLLSFIWSHKLRILKSGL